MITTRKDYYSQLFIQHNIIPQLKHRYLSVRKQSKKDPKKWIMSRYYMGYSIDLLNDSLKRNDVLIDSSSKIYFDLATWIDSNGITPIFSFDKILRLEQKKKFNDGWYKELMKSYDFAIDLDSKNINTAWKEAKIIKNIFDIHKLPYSLRFSGTKGFHFLIDSKWINLKNKPLYLSEIFGKVVGNIMNDENLKTLDTSIYDPRRILKIAYSLCNNNDEEYVCLPLDDKEFENFKFEDMQLKNVVKKIKFFKRGLLERNHGLDNKELKLNFLKFIKEYK